jgi:hypothetical protein
VQELHEPDDESVDGILRRLAALTEVTQAILDSARAAGNLALALKAIERQEKQLTIRARLTGELKTTHAHLHYSPQLDELRVAILTALQPFPDARIAAATALARLPAGSDEA